MKNKKGFVLIEIIISVILLSISGIALLKVSSNQKQLHDITSKRINFSQYSSIILNNKSINLQNKDINLYSHIKYKYNLKNDALIEVLKNTNIKYTQKYNNMIKLEKHNFLIDKIKISNQDGTSTYITVQL